MLINIIKFITYKYLTYISLVDWIWGDVERNKVEHIRGF